MGDICGMHLSWLQGLPDKVEDTFSQANSEFILPSHPLSTDHFLEILPQAVASGCDHTPFLSDWDKKVANH